MGSLRAECSCGPVQRARRRRVRRAAGRRFGLRGGGRHGHEIKADLGGAPAQVLHHAIVVLPLVVGHALVDVGLAVREHAVETMRASLCAVAVIALAGPRRARSRR